MMNSPDRKESSKAFPDKHRQHVPAQRNPLEPAKASHEHQRDGGELRCNPLALVALAFRAD